MARKRGGLLEDLMTISAKMPWPAGVILAVASGIGFHVLAVQMRMPLPPAKTPVELGIAAQHGLFGAIASIFQWVFPIAFLVGAAVSLARRSKRRRLFHTAESGSRTVNSMSWSEFELLIAEAFRRQGYAVADNVVAGPDGGVDLVLCKESKTYLVQCKQWRTQSVGVKVVRELFGVVSARKAAGGFVVSSGQFTAEAKTFAASCGVDLIDGVRLQQMIAGVQKSWAAARAAEAKPAAANDAVIAPDPMKPCCPRCGGSMVLRTAKQGSGAGSQFWGCRSFPQCRGTVGVQ